MGIDAQVLDGAGSARKARVSNNNGMYVAPVVPDVLPIGAPNRYRYLNQLLTLDGTPTGTSNMNVNGSPAAPIEFFIQSNKDYDIRIMQIVIILADGSVSHNNFGGISALSNGWTLKDTESGVDTDIITEAKTGGQIIVQSGLSRPYGLGTSSFELSNWTGSTDAQTIVIEMDKIVPGGLRIGRGTRDRITSVVQDDLRNLFEFTVRIIGYRHYPEGVS